MSEDDRTSLSLSRLVELRHDDGHVRQGDAEGRGSWHGPFRGRRRGQGMDFDDLRPYSVGDDTRHIDWRSSARRDRIHTRLYREEKDHVVTVAVDLRASMFTGSQRLRAVEAGELAARILWRASRGGCRTAAIVLEDTGISRSRQGTGERGALAACQLIAASFASTRRRVESTAESTPFVPPHPTVIDSPYAISDTRRNQPLDKLVTTLLDGGRRHGASIIITGGDDRGGDFEAALARHHLARPLAMILITDPIEANALPAGRYRYAGASGSTKITIDRATAERISRQLADHRRALIDSVEQLHIPLLQAEAGFATTLRRLRDDGFRA